jgi:hypothetical protein
VDSLLIRPQITPRSTRDLNRTVLTGGLVILQLIALMGLVAVLSYVVARDWMWALPAASIAIASVAVVVGFSQVHWLRLDASGMTFGRRLGTPRHLGWERITSIRPASSAEVIRQGWLWPVLPPREATRSLTSEGHYRIAWDRRFCFFPPLDEHAFRSAVERWAPGVLAEGPLA